MESWKPIEVEGHDEIGFLQLEMDNSEINIIFMNMVNMLKADSKINNVNQHLHVFLVILSIDF